MRKYSGFTIRDIQNKKEFDFVYPKHQDNVAAEREAIAKLMQRFNLPRANFIVSKLIK